ncbi:MAG: Ig domain-containing protein [Planctomycetes bacterium]|nr:Ig domain-containing protein [Planctomycetota bacterium]
MHTRLPIIILTALLLFSAGCDEERASGSPAALKVTTTLLPNTFNGLTYNQQLAATGGTQPYNWSIVSGALPTGLTLDAPTGLISGVANDVEGFYYYFTVQAQDAAGHTAQADLRIFIDGTVVPHEEG